LVLLNNTVIDTPITLAIVVEPLRHFPISYFLIDSIVKEFIKQSIYLSYNKYFSLVTINIASIK
jgi:hypothetical protein